MRKALIAVAVATALFAVGAFAASFAVQSEDVASGSDPVDRCTTSASVDFTETFDTANNDWEITEAVVTFTGAGCDNRLATLVLQDQGPAGPVVYDGTIEVDGTTATFVPLCTGSSAPAATVTCPAGWTHLPVSEVWNAAVLIDGLPVPSI